MCNRYALGSSVSYIERELLADFTNTYSPFYNAHPGGEYPVILNDQPEKIQFVKWGLIPYWSKWSDMNYYYNAAVPALVKHPAYRLPIRKNRCLVPANCYYCWVRQERGKTPHVIYIKDQRLFTMAGIYDIWHDKSSGRRIVTFSIIIGNSNKRISKYHPTMPVIIPPSRRTKYLKRGIPLQDVMRMLRPFETDQINLYPVSNKINNLSQNTVEMLWPIGQRLYPEYTYTSKVYLKLEGMGSMKDNTDRKPFVIDVNQ